MANKINNIDLQTVFGVSLRPGGSESFLQLPKRKSSLEHNWPERDGIDIDLTEPTFEARDFRLKCLLMASGATLTEARDNFWLLYNGLFTELSQPGHLDLFLGDYNKTFTLYYQGQDSLDKLTKVTSKKVCLSFDLLFSEADPSDNIEAVYLVDEQDRYIIG